MSFLLRALGFGTAAGVATYGYNRAAKAEWLGQSAPYVYPPEFAAATVAVTTTIARAAIKNPFVALGVGSTTFTLLCFKGMANDEAREQAWAAYHKQGVIPSRELLELELKRSDEIAKSRKFIAEHLLQTHYLKTDIK